MRFIRILVLAVVICASFVSTFAVEIEASETSAEAETEVIICPQCGHENEPGLKFCTNCGAPLPDTLSEVEVMCPRCKARMPYGSISCPECGYKFVKVIGPPRKFFGTVAAGIMSGKDTRPPGFRQALFDRHPAVFSVSFGTRLKEYLAVSFTSGYEYWWYNFDIAYMGTADVYRDSQRTIPLLAKAKAFYKLKGFAPAGYAEFGYGISTLRGECDFPELGYEEPINGLIVGFGGGFDVYVTRNFGFLAEIGWRRQSTPDPYLDLSYFRAVGGVFL